MVYALITSATVETTGFNAPWFIMGLKGPPNPASSVPMTVFPPGEPIRGTTIFPGPVPCGIFPLYGKFALFEKAVEAAFMNAANGGLQGPPALVNKTLGLELATAVMNYLTLSIVHLDVVGLIPLLPWPSLPVPPPIIAAVPPLPIVPYPFAEPMMPIASSETGIGLFT